MSGSAMSLVLFWTAFGLISYTYMVFPVLLAALARISGSRMTESPGCARDIDLPHLTMIVAAHNEEGVLAAKLANTWQIDYPRAKFEILIGSDGSDDETVSILKSITDQRLRFFAFADRRGKISVLNDLLKAADSDIVVMSDANTMFAPDALRKLVGHFGDDRVGCVSGELSLEQAGGVSGEGLYWKYEGWIKHNESRLGFLIGCNGGIFALRRALYDPLPASTIIEDFVLTLRVIEKGYQVRFERAARAVEPACESSRAEMTRKIRIGAGGWQALGLTHALLHPHYGAAAFAFWGHKVLRWLIPHFYLVGLAANFGLLHVPFYSVCLAVQACAALVALYAYCARGRSLPRFLRPVSYFYLMNYALGVGFLRFVFRTQRVTWERGVRNSELAAIEPGPTVESKDTSTFAARGEIPSR